MWVEAHLGIPTRQEMADIEPSEILYRENNARYMTARIICHAETEQPAAIVTREHLLVLVEIRHVGKRRRQPQLVRPAQAGADGVLDLAEAPREGELLLVVELLVMEQVRGNAKARTAHRRIL